MFREGGCGLARLSEELDDAPEDVHDSADAPSPQRALPATYSLSAQHTLVCEEPQNAVPVGRGQSDICPARRYASQVTSALKQHGAAVLPLNVGLDRYATKDREKGCGGDEA